MTLAEATTRVRRFARATGNATVDITDTVIMDAINDGQREFAKEAKGLIKEGYITLAPTFDTEVNFAINLTITGGADAMAATDVAVTGTARSNVAGAQLATDLQATIRTAVGTATPTVTWSATTWKFTLTTAATGTSITLAAPSGITYINALDLFGFEAGTTTGYAVTDNIPQDCAVEEDLPSDFLALVPPVEWDNDQLEPAMFDIFASPEVSGVPECYGIRNNKIRLYPTPREQKLFHIWYRYSPTSFTDAATDAAVELYTPALYHTGVVYYAASLIAEENHEYPISDRMLARFKEYIGKYVTAQANSNPTITPGAVSSRRFRVVM